MSKSQETFSKKEKEKKRLKKRQDKQQKREERRASKEDGGSSEDMIAYVDEDGNITDTPPDPRKKKKIDAKKLEVGVPKKEEEDINAVRTGRVEFFNESRGFGFIKETGTQEQYFVHVHGMLEEVRENDMVTFELERGMKGMNAVRVKKA